MSDIHIGKRGPETAHEERPDKLKKTVRFEQEAPSWNILRVVRNKIGRCPHLCRVQVVSMTTCKVSALDVFYEMDGRKSRYIRDVLDWCRGEDAGDSQEK